MRLWLLLMLMTVALPAAAAPLDASLQQDLLALYDRYNQAITAGKFTDAATLRAGESRTELLGYAKLPKAAQQRLLTMARMMTPDTVSPLHATLAANGDSASIIAIGSKTMPAGIKLPGAPKPGTVTRNEMTLSFVREGQTWKFADQIFGPDPAAIKSCHDSPTEAETDYDHDRESSVGGVIRRVDFKPDHTLVIVRVVDEDNCLILPTRDWLLQHQTDPAKFVPWATIEVEGIPHRTDKQRMWAGKWTVTDE
jgi:hypothetical protein